ncbi:MAG: MBL fold metallo-hydrolase [Myxococcales bacterium]|nr:MBL fold metallo-hydrolase [Myxococcales bacterium]MCB9641937.1 MBL fold metallo-hydrolase [Myxococcales bacterium]
MSSLQPIQIDQTLWLLPLDQPREGFRQFISTWLYHDQKIAFVVDPGPTATIPRLVEALRQQGIEKLDAVLLTHIHLDHGGGTGALVEQFPVDRVLCHPQGIPHLIEPTRLWEGSVKVLGDLATMYGPLTPVPAEKLVSTEDVDTLCGRPIQLIPTPGHAPHQVAFAWEGALFLGEAGGVLQETAQGPYLRPATPPAFRRGVFLQSIKTLRELAPSLTRLCYGHFGSSTQPVEMLEQAEEQLLRWLSVVDAHGQEDDLALIERLQQVDPLFARFPLLDADIQQRERYFVGNSLWGMRTEKRS